MAKGIIMSDDQCMLSNNKKRDGPRGEDTSGGDSFDQLLSYVGASGLWQLKLFFIGSYVGVFFALNNYGAAFLAATPKFRCIPPYINESHLSWDISPPGINSSHPLDIYSKSSCEYYVINESSYSTIDATADVPKNLKEDNLFTGHNGTTFENLTTETCTNFYYDDSIYKSSIVTEWDLVCDRRWLMTLTQSTYMMGMMVGGIVFGELSDMFGRRTMCLLNTVLLIATSIGAAFSQHYITFIVLRFLTAATGSGVFLPNFVTLMELIGTKSRGSFGMFYQGFFSVGTCLLAAAAYFFRDWRTLGLLISVPSLSLLSYYWLIPESPRWLFEHGQEKKALEVLRKVAKGNDRNLPEEEELEVLVKNITNEAKPHKHSLLRNILTFFKNQIMLVRTPNMRRRCIITFFCWFVVSMIYYGLAFNGDNLEASPYVIIFLSGIVELPSFYIVSLVLKRFGRRISFLSTFVLCGASCMLILAVPKDMVWLNLTLVSVGKFFNSSTFAIAFVYSAELVPTKVRNISVGTASMWARIGSAVAPFIVDGLGPIHYTIPSTVFGILSLVAGGLVLLLPETGKMKLPESIEEVEAMER